MGWAVGLLRRGLPAGPARRAGGAPAPPRAVGRIRGLCAASPGAGPSPRPRLPAQPLPWRLGAGFVSGASLLTALPQAWSRVPRGFERFSRDLNELSEGEKKASPSPEDGRDEKGRKSSGGGPFKVFGVAVLGFIIFLDVTRRWRKYDEGLAGFKDREISTQAFLTQCVANNLVESVEVINKEFARVKLRAGADRSAVDEAQLPPLSGSGHYYFRIGSVDAFERKLESFQAAIGVHPTAYVPVVYSNHFDVVSEGLSYVPTWIIILLSILLFRKLIQAGVDQYPRRFLRVAKANPTQAKDVKSKVFFKDIAGMKEAKQEVLEFVDFLKAPRKYEKLGARIPKGALLVGAPGTGKTLLAKAVAGEANVPFFSMSGSDFLEMFVGVGPSRVRDLFAQARKAAPSIIFIDEIDAVGRKRAKGGFSNGSNDERENTLNAMLVEMDGFNSGTNVVVLAGTNRADILDPALTRPGRFDRTVTIEKPDLAERKEMFAIHAKNLKLDKSLVPTEVHQRLAALTPGFAGADIANICNEAAIFAARRNGEAVAMRDFENACERVMAGAKKSTGFINRELRNVIAVHESGHAVAGWFLKYADPVLKVSIVPRTSGALGFAQNLPDEVQLLPREQVLDKIAVLLAGRISEEIHTQQITTGASDDLNKVTRLAYAFVSVWGFNDKVGQISFQRQQDEAGYYRPYSEELARVIDAEANKLVQEQYQRVTALLTEKSHLVKALTARLLEKETIDFRDLQEVLGPRPHKVKEEYKVYVEAAPTREEMQEPAPPPAPTPELPAGDAPTAAPGGGSGGGGGGPAPGGVPAPSDAAPPPASPPSGDGRKPPENPGPPGVTDGPGGPSASGRPSEVFGPEGGGNPTIR